MNEMLIILVPPCHSCGKNGKERNIEKGNVEIRMLSHFLTFVEMFCKSTEYLLQVQKWHAGLCND